MRSHCPSCAATAVMLLTSPTTASAHHAYGCHLVMRVIRLPPATGVLRVPPPGSLPQDTKSMARRERSGRRAPAAWAAGQAAVGDPTGSLGGITRIISEG